MNSGVLVRTSGAIVLANSNSIETREEIYATETRFVDYSYEQEEVKAIEPETEVIEDDYYTSSRQQRSYNTRSRRSSRRQPQSVAEAMSWFDDAFGNNGFFAQNIGNGLRF